MIYSVQIDLTSIVEQIKEELKNYIDEKINELKSKTDNNFVEEVNEAMEVIVDKEFTSLEKEIINPPENSTSEIITKEEDEDVNEVQINNSVQEEEKNNDGNEQNISENESINMEETEEIHEEGKESKNQIVVLHSTEHLSIEQLRIMNKRLLNIMPKQIKREIQRNKSIYNNRSKKCAIALYKKLLEVIESANLVEIKYLFKLPSSEMSNAIEKSLDILKNLISSNTTKFKY